MSTHLTILRYACTKGSDLDRVYVEVDRRPSTTELSEYMIPLKVNFREGKKRVQATGYSQAMVFNYRHKHCLGFGFGVVKTRFHGMAIVVIGLQLVKSLKKRTAKGGEITKLGGYTGNFNNL